MIYAYDIIEFPADGLMRTWHTEFGKQLWSLVKLRKHKNVLCVMCGETVGEKAYRPLTNGYNRMHRICERHEDDAHISKEHTIAVAAEAGDA